MGGNWTYDCTELNRLFLNDAELVGYLIGDGCVEKYKVTLCAGSDSEALWLEDKVKGLSVPYSIRKQGNCVQVIICRMGLASFLLAEGCGGPARSKKVPPHIMEGVSVERRKFLRGLFQADGTINRCTVLGRKSGCVVGLVTASSVLAEGVKELLALEGIDGVVYGPVFYKGHCHYRLIVRGLLSKTLYLENIGFSFGEKQRRVRSWFRYYEKKAIRSEKYQVACSCGI